MACRAAVAVAEAAAACPALAGAAGKSGSPDLDDFDPTVSFAGEQFTAARALAEARFLQREELWRTERALRRLSTVLARLSETAPPKVLVYFADRLRSRPGDQYLALFNGAQVQGKGGARARTIASDGEMARLTFDDLVNEANAHGVRMYAVQAEGLTTPANVRVGKRGTTMPDTSRLVRDAQGSLTTLSLETGGRPFVGAAARGARIVSQIQEDLQCLYLLSFDPGELPRDNGLRVLVRVTVPGVQARVRGQTVVQSEEGRRTSRLLAAFAAPELVESDFEVQGTLVPTGYADGRYTALVQLAVAGLPMSEATWDLGASLVSRGKVHQHAAERVRLRGRGPVVLEAEVTLAPGPYSLSLVAAEELSNQIRHPRRRRRLARSRRRSGDRRPDRRHAGGDRDLPARRRGPQAGGAGP